MIIQQPWQQSFIETLRQHLYTHQDILALVVFGSAAQIEPKLDLWSDVDVLMVTTEKGIDTFFPGVDWLRPLAPIYAYEQHTNGLMQTTRLCFTDMRRVDLVFITETTLKETHQAKFWQPGRVVFSKVSAVTEQLLKANNAPSFSLPSAAEFERMVEQFWYRSTVAVYKVIREDCLIAWHLSLELIQDCCVLGMMLRDRREQTNHHRSGGMGNNLVAQLPTFPESYSSTAILEVIAQTAVLFDDLAGQWSEAYEGRKQPLQAWIQSLIGDSD